MGSMQEVSMVIGRDGKVTLHFNGMKAEVRHSLAKELEQLIGPAVEREHGPEDGEVHGHMHLDTEKD